jgi:hypothetical protein
MLTSGKIRNSSSSRLVNVRLNMILQVVRLMVILIRMLPEALNEAVLVYSSYVRRKRT